ncbi:MAG: radical SAM protein [Candidatus Omnitrophota bacterium]
MAAFSRRAFLTGLGWATRYDDKKTGNRSEARKSDLKAADAPNQNEQEIQALASALPAYLNIPGLLRLGLSLERSVYDPGQPVYQESFRTRIRNANSEEGDPAIVLNVYKQKTLVKHAGDSSKNPLKVVVTSIYPQLPSRQGLGRTLFWLLLVREMAWQGEYAAIWNAKGGSQAMMKKMPELLVPGPNWPDMEFRIPILSPEQRRAVEVIFEKYIPVIPAFPVRSEARFVEWPQEPDWNEPDLLKGAMSAVDYLSKIKKITNFYSQFTEAVWFHKKTKKVDQATSADEGFSSHLSFTEMQAVLGDLARLLDLRQYGIKDLGETTAFAQLKKNFSDVKNAFLGNKETLRMVNQQSDFKKHAAAKNLLKFKGETPKDAVPYVLLFPYLMNAAFNPEFKFYRGDFENDLEIFKAGAQKILNDWPKVEQAVQAYLGSMEKYQSESEKPAENAAQSRSEAREEETVFTTEPGSSWRTPQMIAVGGNAFSSEDEIKKFFTNEIVEKFKAGGLVTHGNGPQAGQLLEKEGPPGMSQEAAVKKLVTGKIVERTQKEIGGMIKRALMARGIAEEKIAIIPTHVLVDPKDAEFKKPTKPLGALSQDGSDHRIRVPSPAPEHIVEIAEIAAEIKKGKVVICVGGGGTPVDEHGNVLGAVVDKDLATALLARELRPLGITIDTLTILMSQPHLYYVDGQGNKNPLLQLTFEDIEELLKEDLERKQFPDGSIRPKMIAAADFVKNGGRVARITRNAAPGSSEGTVVMQDIKASDQRRSEPSSRSEARFEMRKSEKIIQEALRSGKLALHIEAPAEIDLKQDMEGIFRDWQAGDREKQILERMRKGETEGKAVAFILNFRKDLQAIQDRLKNDIERGEMAPENKEAFVQWDKSHLAPLHYYIGKAQGAAESVSDGALQDLVDAIVEAFWWDLKAEQLAESAGTNKILDDAREGDEWQASEAKKDFLQAISEIGTFENRTANQTVLYGLQVLARSFPAVCRNKVKTVFLDLLGKDLFRRNAFLRGQLFSLLVQDFYGPDVLELLRKEIERNAKGSTLTLAARDLLWRLGEPGVEDLLIDYAKQRFFEALPVIDVLIREQGTVKIPKEVRQKILFYAEASDGEWEVSGVTHAGTRAYLRSWVLQLRESLELSAEKSGSLSYETENFWVRPVLTLRDLDAIRSFDSDFDFGNAFFRKNIALLISKESRKIVGAFRVDFSNPTEENPRPWHPVMSEKIFGVEDPALAKAAFEDIIAGVLKIYEKRFGKFPLYVDISPDEYFKTTGSTDFAGMSVDRFFKAPDFMKQFRASRSEMRSGETGSGKSIRDEDLPEVSRGFKFSNPYHLHNMPSRALAELALALERELKLYVFVRKGDGGKKIFMSSVPELLSLGLAYNQDVEIFVKGLQNPILLSGALGFAERAMQDWRMLEGGTNENPLFDAYLQEINRMAKDSGARDEEQIRPDALNRAEMRGEGAAGKIEARSEQERERLAASFQALEKIQRPVKTLFVMPMYNEARRLHPKTDENPLGEDALRLKVAQFEALRAANPNFLWRLLAVDDGTPDLASASTIKEIWEEILADYARAGKPLDPAQVQTVAVSSEEKKKSGSRKGYATVKAMKQAVTDSWAEFIGYTDTDISTNVAQTPLLLEKLMEGEADAAIGSRWVIGGEAKVASISRYLSSKLFNLAVRTLLPPLGSIHDTQRGFKLFTRDLLSVILKHERDPGMSFDTELLLLTKMSGAKVLEVPISWFDSSEASTVALADEAKRMIKGILKYQCPHLFDLGLYWNLSRERKALLAQTPASHRSEARSLDVSQSPAAGLDSSETQTGEWKGVPYKFTDIAAMLSSSDKKNQGFLLVDKMTEGQKKKFLEFLKPEIKKIALNYLRDPASDPTEPLRNKQLHKEDFTAMFSGTVHIGVGDDVESSPVLFEIEPRPGKEGKEEATLRIFNRSTPEEMVAPEEYEVSIGKKYMVAREYIPGEETGAAEVFTVDSPYMTAGKHFSFRLLWDSQGLWITIEDYRSTNGTVLSADIYPATIAYEGREKDLIRYREIMQLMIKNTAPAMKGDEENPVEGDPIHHYKKALDEAAKLYLESAEFGELQELRKELIRYYMLSNIVGRADDRMNYALELLEKFLQEDRITAWLPVFEMAVQYLPVGKADANFLRLLRVLRSEKLKQAPTGLKREALHFLSRASSNPKEFSSEPLLSAAKKQTMRIDTAPADEPQGDVRSETRITPEERKILEEKGQRIFDYLAVRKEYVPGQAPEKSWISVALETLRLDPSKKNLAMVLGTWDERTAHEAARVIKELRTGDPKIKVLTSGKYGNKPGIFYDKKGNQLPEAEGYSQIMGKEGVSVDFVERGSTNSGANIVFSKKILDAASFKPDVIFLMQNPILQGRAGLTAVRQYSGSQEAFDASGVRLISYAPYKPVAAHQKDSDLLRDIGFGLAELQSLDEYPGKGFTIRTVVPQEISSAREDLLLLLSKIKERSALQKGSLAPRTFDEKEVDLEVFDPEDVDIGLKISPEVFDKTGMSRLVFDRVHNHVLLAGQPIRLSEVSAKANFRKNDRMKESYEKNHSGREVYALPNGNLGLNNFYLAAVRKKAGGKTKVFYYSHDPLVARTMLVVRKGQKPSAMLLSFKKKANGTVRVIDPAKQQDITDDLEIALYGLPVIRDGRLNLKEALGQLDDLRHLFRLPRFDIVEADTARNEWVDQVHLGMSDGIGIFYKDPDLLARLFSGRPVTLSVDPLLSRGVTFDEIEAVYNAWGYRGKYELDRATHTVTATYEPGTHPHSYFGITQNGKVFIGALSGDLDTHFKGISFRGLYEQLKERREFAKDPVQHLWVWANGKDVSFRSKGSAPKGMRSKNIENLLFSRPVRSEMRREFVVSGKRVRIAEMSLKRKEWLFEAVPELLKRSQGKTKREVAKELFAQMTMAGLGGITLNGLIWIIYTKHPELQKLFEGTTPKTKKIAKEALAPAPKKIDEKKKDEPWKGRLSLVAKARALATTPREMDKRYKLPSGTVGRALEAEEKPLETIETFSKAVEADWASIAEVVFGISPEKMRSLGMIFNFISKEPEAFAKENPEAAFYMAIAGYRLMANPSQGEAWFAQIPTEEITRKGSPILSQLIKMLEEEEGTFQQQKQWHGISSGKMALFMLEALFHKDPKKVKAAFMALKITERQAVAASSYGREWLKELRLLEDGENLEDLIHPVDLKKIQKEEAPDPLEEAGSPEDVAEAYRDFSATTMRYATNAVDYNRGTDPGKNDVGRAALERLDQLYEEVPGVIRVPRDELMSFFREKQAELEANKERLIKSVESLNETEKEDLLRWHENQRSELRTEAAKKLKAQLPLTPESLRSLRPEKNENGPESTQKLAGKLRKEFDRTGEEILFLGKDLAQSLWENRSVTFQLGRLSLTCFQTKQEISRYVYSISDPEGTVIGHGMFIYGRWSKTLFFRYSIHKEFRGLGYGEEALAVFMASMLQGGLFNERRIRKFEWEERRTGAYGLLVPDDAEVFLQKAGFKQRFLSGRRLFRMPDSFSEIGGLSALKQKITKWLWQKPDYRLLIALLQHSDMPAEQRRAYRILGGTMAVTAPVIWAVKAAISLGLGAKFSDMMPLEYLKIFAEKITLALFSLDINLAKEAFAMASVSSAAYILLSPFLRTALFIMPAAVLSGFKLRLWVAFFWNLFPGAGAFISVPIQVIANINKDYKKKREISWREMRDLHKQILESVRPQFSPAQEPLRSDLEKLSAEITCLLFEAQAKEVLPDHGQGVRVLSTSLSAPYLSENIRLGVPTVFIGANAADYENLVRRIRKLGEHFGAPPFYRLETKLFHDAYEVEATGKIRQIKTLNPSALIRPLFSVRSEMRGPEKTPRNRSIETEALWEKALDAVQRKAPEKFTPTDHLNLRYALAQEVAMALGTQDERITKIWLFGSVSEGNVENIGPQSDIDLILEVKSEAGKKEVMALVDAADKILVRKMNDYFHYSEHPMPRLVNIGEKVFLKEEIGSLYISPTLLFERNVSKERMEMERKKKIPAGVDISKVKEAVRNYSRGAWTCLAHSSMVIYILRSLGEKATLVGMFRKGEDMPFQYMASTARWGEIDISPYDDEEENYERTAPASEKDYERMLAELKTNGSLTRADKALREGVFLFDKVPEERSPRSEMRAATFEGKLGELYRKAGVKVRRIENKEKGILHPTPADAFDAILQAMDIPADGNVTILDAGSGQVQMLIRFAMARPDIKKLIGIEYEPELVQESKKVLQLAVNEGLVKPGQIVIQQADFNDESSKKLFEEADRVYYFHLGTTDTGALINTLGSNLRPGARVAIYPSQQRPDVYHRVALAETGLFDAKHLPWVSVFTRLSDTISSARSEERLQKSDSEYRFNVTAASESVSPAEWGDLKLDQQALREALSNLSWVNNLTDANGFKLSNAGRKQGILLSGRLEGLIREKERTGDRRLTLYEVGLGEEPRETREILAMIQMILRKLAGKKEIDLEQWKVELVGMDEFARNVQTAEKSNRIHAMIRASNGRLTATFKQANALDLQRLSEIADGKKGDIILFRNTDYANTLAQANALHLKDVRLGKRGQSLTKLLNSYLARRNLFLAFAKKGSLYVIDPASGQNPEAAALSIPGTRLLGAKKLLSGLGREAKFAEGSPDDIGTGIYEIEEPAGVLNGGLLHAADTILGIWEIKNASEATKDRTEPAQAKKEVAEPARPRLPSWVEKFFGSVRDVRLEGRYANRNKTYKGLDLLLQTIFDEEKVLWLGLEKRDGQIEAGRVMEQKSHYWGAIKNLKLSKEYQNIFHGFGVVTFTSADRRSTMVLVVPTERIPFYIQDSRPVRSETREIKPDSRLQTAADRPKLSATVQPVPVAAKQHLGVPGTAPRVKFMLGLIFPDVSAGEAHKPWEWGLNLYVLGTHVGLFLLTEIAVLCFWSLIPSSLKWVTLITVPGFVELVLLAGYAAAGFFWPLVFLHRSVKGLQEHTNAKMRSLAEQAQQAGDTLLAEALGLIKGVELSDYYGVLDGRKNMDRKTLKISKEIATEPVLTYAMVRGALGMFFAMGHPECTVWNKMAWRVFSTRELMRRVRLFPGMLWYLLAHDFVWNGLSLVFFLSRFDGGHYLTVALKLVLRRGVPSLQAVLSQFISLGRFSKRLTVKESLPQKGDEANRSEAREQNSHETRAMSHEPNFQTQASDLSPQGLGIRSEMRADKAQDQTPALNPGSAAGAPYIREMRPVDESLSSIRIGKDVYQIASETNLSIVMTDRCNAGCPFCINRTGSHHSGEAVALNFSQKISKAIEAYHVRDVVLLGGEPLLAPHLREVLRELDKVKGQLDEITITTNGTQFRDRNILELVGNSAVTSVNISYHHYDKKRNDAIMGTSTLTLEEIESIHRFLRSKGKTLRINVTALKGGIDNVLDLEKFAGSFGNRVEVIKLTPVYPTASYGTIESVSEFTESRAFSRQEWTQILDGLSAKGKILDVNEDMFGVGRTLIELPAGVKMLLVNPYTDKKEPTEIRSIKILSDGKMSLSWLGHGPDLMTAAVEFPRIPNIEADKNTLPARSFARGESASSGEVRAGKNPDQTPALNAGSAAGEKRSEVRGVPASLEEAIRTVREKDLTVGEIDAIRKKFLTNEKNERELFSALVTDTPQPLRLEQIVSGEAIQKIETILRGIGERSRELSLPSGQVVADIRRTIGILQRWLPPHLFKCFYEDEPVNVGHALPHALADLEYCLRIIRNDANISFRKTDIQLLCYAAIFHDLAGILYREHHETNSIIWMRRILEKEGGLTAEETDKIEAFLSGHKKTAEAAQKEELRTYPEARVFKDADALAGAMDLERIYGVWKAWSIQESETRKQKVNKFYMPELTLEQRKNSLKAGRYEMADGITDLVKWVLIRRSPEYYLTAGGKKIAASLPRDSGVVMAFIESKREDLKDFYRLTGQDLTAIKKIVTTLTSSALENGLIRSGVRGVGAENPDRSETREQARSLSRKAKKAFNVFGIPVLFTAAILLLQDEYLALVKRSFAVGMLTKGALGAATGFMGEYVTQSYKGVRNWKKVGVWTGVRAVLTGGVTFGLLYPFLQVLTDKVWVRVVLDLGPYTVFFTYLMIHIGDWIEKNIGATKTNGLTLKERLEYLVFFYPLHTLYWAVVLSLAWPHGAEIVSICSAITSGYSTIIQIGMLKWWMGLSYAKRERYLGWYVRPAEKAIYPARAWIARKTGMDRSRSEARVEAAAERIGKLAEQVWSGFTARTVPESDVFWKTLVVEYKEGRVTLEDLAEAFVRVKKEHGEEMIEKMLTAKLGFSSLWDQDHGFPEGRLTRIFLEKEVEVGMALKVPAVFKNLRHMHMRPSGNLARFGDGVKGRSRERIHLFLIEPATGRAFNASEFLSLQSSGIADGTPLEVVAEFLGSRDLAEKAAYKMSELLQDTDFQEAAFGGRNLKNWFQEHFPDRSEARDETMKGIPDSVISLARQLESVGQVKELLREASGLRAWGAKISGEFLSVLETMAFIFGFESGPGLTLVESEGSIVKNAQVSSADQEEIWRQMYSPDNYGRKFADIGEVKDAISLALASLSRDGVVVYSRIKQYKSLLEKLRAAVAKIKEVPVESVGKDAREIFEEVERLKDRFRENPVEYFDDLVGFDVVIDDARMDEHQRAAALTSMTAEVRHLLSQHPGWKVVTVRKDGRVKGYESVNIWVMGLLDHKKLGALPVKIQIRFFNALKHEMVMRYVFKTTGQWKYPPWITPGEVNAARTVQELRKVMFRSFKTYTKDMKLSEEFDIWTHVTWRPGMPQIFAYDWMNRLAAATAGGAKESPKGKAIPGAVSSPKNPKSDTSVRSEMRGKNAATLQDTKPQNENVRRVAAERVAGEVRSEARQIKPATRTEIVSSSLKPSGVQPVSTVPGTTQADVSIGFRRLGNLSYDTGTDEQIFAFSSEAGYDAVLESIRLSDPAIRNTAVHIGVSGMQNLDIMAARHSRWGILLDVNKRTVKFFNLVEGIFKDNPGISKREFLEALFRRMDQYKATRPQEANYFLNSYQNLMLEMTTDRSWLTDNARFQHIKAMFLEDRIVSVRGVAEDKNIFKKFRDWMSENGLTLDTFYISNVIDYVPAQEREDFYASIVSVSNGQTFILDSANPDGIRLRVRKKEEFQKDNPGNGSDAAARSEAREIKPATSPETVDSSLKPSDVQPASLASSAAPWRPTSFDFEIPPEAILAQDSRLGTIVLAKKLLLTAGDRLKLMDEIDGLNAVSFAGSVIFETASAWNDRLVKDDSLILFCRNPLSANKWELRGVLWSRSENERVSRIERFMTEQDKVRGQGSFLMDTFFRRLISQKTQITQWKAETPAARDFYDRYLPKAQGQGLILSFTPGDQHSEYQAILPGFTSVKDESHPGTQNQTPALNSASAAAAERGEAFRQTVRTAIEDLKGHFTIMTDMADVAEFTDAQLQEFETMAILQPNVKFVFYGKTDPTSEVGKRLSQLQAELGANRIVITESGAEELTLHKEEKVIQISKASTEYGVRGSETSFSRRTPYALRRTAGVFSFRYIADETGLVPMALLYADQHEKPSEKGMMDLSMVSAMLRAELREFQNSIVFARAA